MPRLTPKRYLRTHDKLRLLWLHQQRLFAELPSHEQWLLYDYFKPDKDWSDLELLHHRDRISAERPSLPQQSGRALIRSWETTAQLATRRLRATKALAGPAKRVRQRNRHITVKPLVRPEIDVHKLARAYINLAVDLQKRRQENEDEDRAA